MTTDVIHRERVILDGRGDIMAEWRDGAWHLPTEPVRRTPAERRVDRMRAQLERIVAAEADRADVRAAAAHAALIARLEATPNDLLTVGERMALAEHRMRRAAASVVESFFPRVTGDES
jgi:hypothetical protein